MFPRNDDEYNNYFNEGLEQKKHRSGDQYSSI